MCVVPQHSAEELLRGSTIVDATDRSPALEERGAETPRRNRRLHPNAEFSEAS